MKYNQPYGAAANAPYVNGDPSTGTPGSIPPAAAIEYPQREIANLIEKAGLTPSDADLMQLLKAVRSHRLNFAIPTGTANALAVTLDPPLTAYTPGLMLLLQIQANNSGATTLNVNGLGAVSVGRADGSALRANDLLAGEIALLVYDGITAFQVAHLNPVNIPASNTLIFNTPGTTAWVAPAGVRRVSVQVWAGGGGGGGCNGTLGSGSGAGGGEYRRGIFAVTPGASYNVVVGAGGTGGAGGGSPTNGGTGGTSSFGSLISAIGGGGGFGFAGTGGASTASIPGTGGTGGIGIAGGQGGIGYPIGGANAGGTGGPAFSASIPSPNVAAQGAFGIFPGGGGSGSSANANGGTGAGGLIILEVLRGGMSNILQLPLLEVDFLTSNNEDWVDSLAFYLADETTPIDLAGITFDMHLRKPAAGVQAYLSASSAGDSPEIVVGGTGNNVLALSVPVTVVERIPPDTYQHDILARADGFARVVASGTVTVRQGITRDLTS